MGLALAALVIAGGIIGSWLDQRGNNAGIEREVDKLRQQVAALARSASDLNENLYELRRRVGVAEKRAEGTRALAARVLPSVFTVETPDGEAAGFAAWRSGSQIVLVTAAHVVSGWDEVTVRRGGRSWTGQVIKVDEVNDLASVRVPISARPLWQEPSTQLPDIGATLVLFGSPLGYEGTVTRGVVSRVTYNEIQTDAPATFGSSGGPAVTEEGKLVGVLTSGFEGTDINFIVPIRRACIELRSC